jgi:hypothetical protein
MELYRADLLEKQQFAHDVPPWGHFEPALIKLSH